MLALIQAIHAELKGAYGSPRMVRELRERGLVQAWIEIHREELMADWNLAVSGESPFRIDPLR